MLENKKGGILRRKCHLKTQNNRLKTLTYHNTNYNQQKGS